MHPASIVVFWRGHCLTWVGRVEEGLDALAMANRMAEEDDTPEVNIYASQFAAEARYLIHDVDGALASARRSEETSRRLGDPAMHVGPAQLALGYAHLVAGRLVDAVEAARESLRLYGLADKASAGFPAALLAEALLESGDLTDAQASAEHAIALCRQLLTGHHEARAHGVLARAILRSGGVAAREAVEAALANAAQLIERTGAQILAPSLCEWRAELAAALGDDASRIRLLIEARNHFERMGAPFQVQRLDKLLSASRS
ncbi:MAG: hypothetical protein NT024_00065, partial [Proteobacteria bacterium]|nr:hypothetical protein [Pseudomonadota bacterium]